MTQRARDPHPRLTIDVDEDHRARHAAVRRRPQTNRRPDLGPRQRVLGEHLRAQRIIEEHPPTQRLPAGPRRRPHAVPQRRRLRDRPRPLPGRQQLAGRPRRRQHPRVPLRQQVPADRAEAISAEAHPRVQVLRAPQRALERGAPRRRRPEVALALGQQPGLAERRGRGLRRHARGRRGDHRDEWFAATTGHERECECEPAHAQVAIIWTRSRRNSGERRVWRVPSIDTSTSSTNGCAYRLTVGPSVVVTCDQSGSARR